jgi:hypothetical protein
MTATTSSVLDQALSLPPEERRELALHLLLSVEKRRLGLSKSEMANLLADRVAAIESGEYETVDASDVISRLRERCEGPSK